MTGSRLPAPWQNEANVLACTLRAGGIPAFVADWTGHDIVIRGNTLGTGLKRYERR